MQITLTDEQHLMLELIADHPLPAIPEIVRYTSVLAAARLIQLTFDKRWKVTRDGEAMLSSMAVQGYWVH